MPLTKINVVFSFLLFSVCSIFFSQTKSIEDIDSTHFFGIWKLEKYIDSLGNTIPKTHYNKFDDVLIFNSDGSSVQFFSPNSKKVSSWVYDANKNAVLLKIDVDVTKPSGKYLVKNEFVSLDEDSYKDIFPQKVISLKPNQVVFEELKNRNKVYTKLPNENYLWTQKEIELSFSGLINKQKLIRTTRVIIKGDIKETYLINKDGSTKLLKREKK